LTARANLQEEVRKSGRREFGNACDLDDDNDGFTDAREEQDGTDPLNRFSCKSG